MNRQMRFYYARMAELKDILGGKCVHCGAVDDLQFDHKEASSKCFTIAAGWCKARDVVLEEIKKCQLLCGPCHMAKSVASGDLSRGHRKRRPLVHGTIHGYREWLCRCDACRGARRAYGR